VLIAKNANGKVEPSSTEATKHPRFLRGTRGKDLLRPAPAFGLRRSSSAAPRRARTTRRWTTCGPRVPRARHLPADERFGCPSLHPDHPRAAEKRRRGALGSRTSTAVDRVPRGRPVGTGARSTLGEGQADQSNFRHTAARTTASLRSARTYPAEMPGRMSAETVDARASARYVLTLRRGGTAQPATRRRSRTHDEPDAARASAVSSISRAHRDRRGSANGGENCLSLAGIREAAAAKSAKGRAGVFLQKGQVQEVCRPRRTERPDKRREGGP